MEESIKYRAKNMKLAVDLSLSLAGSLFSIAIRSLQTWIIPDQLEVSFQHQTLTINGLYTVK
jgi:hypothetical protein